MTLRLASVVVDSRNHVALGTWWAETLGWDVVHHDDDELDLAAPVAAEEAERLDFHDRRPELCFVTVPDEKAVKNRLHLDLAPHTSDDRDAEIARLLERGATLADVGQGDDVSWTTLRDPEGNEFCVLSSRES